MIPHGVEVYLALKPIDLRWSFDRLAGLVAAQLGLRPRSGALFVFFGKSRAALKVLFYDGTGLCQFYKRLDRGTFRVPELSVPTEPGTKSISLSERELEDLLDGITVKTQETVKRRVTLH